MRWMTSWDGPETDHWYFVELSWSRRTGLKMYIDLDLVDTDSSPVTRQRSVDSGSGRLYLGADLTPASHASATFDELELWFGERSKLIELDFISRGNS